MQAGQPIWFEFGGAKVFGIVEEVLPEKAGVKAIVKVKGKNIKMEVAEPHKVRDLSAANEVRKAFGLPLVGEEPKAKPPKYNENAKFVPFDELVAGNKFDSEFLSILQKGSALKPKDPEPPKPA